MKLPMWQYSFLPFSSCSRRGYIYSFFGYHPPGFYYCYFEAGTIQWPTPAAFLPGENLSQANIQKSVSMLSATLATI